MPPADGSGNAVRRPNVNDVPNIVVRTVKVLLNCP
jgi:hypothetical protein